MVSGGGAELPHSLERLRVARPQVGVLVGLDDEAGVVTGGAAVQVVVGDKGVVGAEHRRIQRGVVQPDVDVRGVDVLEPFQRHVAPVRQAIVDRLLDAPDLHRAARRIADQDTDFHIILLRRVSQRLGELGYRIKQERSAVDEDVDGFGGVVKQLAPYGLRDVGAHRVRADRDGATARRIEVRPPVRPQVRDREPEELRRDFRAGGAGLLARQPPADGPRADPDGVSELLYRQSLVVHRSAQAIIRHGVLGVLAGHDTRL